MHYVIADVHGCYDKFLAMLEKIGFGEDDTLYFLGDAIDRRPDGIKVLLDLMGRKNVVPFLGNHEDMFYRVIRSIGRELTLDEKLLPGGIGKEPVGQLQIAFLQPALLRLRAEQVHRGSAELQDLPAADPLPAELLRQTCKEICLPQDVFQGGFAQAVLP